MKGKAEFNQKKIGFFFRRTVVDPDQHSSNFVDPHTINADPHPYIIHI